MGEEALVEEMKLVLAELQRTRGPVALFMLVAPDTAVTNFYRLVVSAKGYDGVGRPEAIRATLKLLYEVMSEPERQKIQLMSVLRTHDPLVHAFNSAYKIQNDDLTVFCATVLDVELPKAILLHSQRLAA